MKKFVVTIVMIAVLILGSSLNVLAIDLTGKSAFTLKGGTDIPLRVFADNKQLGADIGFDLGGELTQFVSNRIGIGIQLDYSFFFLEGPGKGSSLRLFNFGVFSKYVISTSSNTIPYLQLEAGLCQPTLAAQSYSIKFGFGLGGGVMFKVNDLILLETRVMFHDALIMDANIKSEGRALGQFGYTIQYIKLDIGIIFLPNRK